MLFWNPRNREQQARNRAKAQALIDEHGEAAYDFVREQIAASSWEIRKQAHWLRVEKHVKTMLGR